MSETELLYSEFGNKGIIKGNAITFEFKMFSTEYEMYKIWIKNKRGEDSFDFNIKLLRKDRTGLITSSSIATVLLIYIIVLHICLIVRHRTNRTRRGHIEEPLHFNTYDEIGPISDEAASTRQLVTDKEGPMLPTSLISSPRSESTITTINNRSSMIVSTSSKVSHQYFQVISARSSYDAETEIIDNNVEVDNDVELIMIVNIVDVEIDYDVEVDNDIEVDNDVEVD
ncbi:unnamed protein product [Mytilus edulis]|uniref:Uncharacterized protein n=1 Tax=Mytilus edulis TaxID=6550 RepID=A0A8S3SK61_MYTED|nr:unnamed protein product [Mytilus edulis]